MQAMILAAGFGTRLLPYTQIKPKPLFPICNIPLLQLTIRRLKKAGFSDIIVNCHHLRDQVRSAIQHEKHVIIQEEQEILGTGGGLRKALSHLKDEPLLITNGDIYHTIPYQSLYDAHLSHDHPVTLAMHDYQRFNSVTVQDGFVTSFEKNTPTHRQKIAFTGVHVIDPCELAPIAENRFSCIIDRYREILQEKRQIAVYRTDNHYWTDIGTKADYLGLHGDILQGRIPLWEELGLNVCSTTLLGNTIAPENIRCQDWCVIGDDVTLSGTLEITRSVIWQGATLDKQKIIDDIVA